LKTIIKELVDMKLEGMPLYSVSLIKMLANSLRFKDIIIEDFVSIVDDKTQFGVMKIRFDNNTIFSFKGTDNSLIGWCENFRLSYMYPIYTQELAKKYLVDNTNLFDTNIYLVGHSKGGNLAIACGMEAPLSLNKRIKRIANFDGPGVLDKEFNSDKYKKIEDRLINYLPENSVIGILMNNKNYQFVKADGIGFMSHMMNTWHTYGSFFVKSELSKTSTKLHENSVMGIRYLNPKELETVVETFFSVIENNGIKRFSDIKKLDKTTLISTINDLSDISKETKEYFMETIKIFMMPERGK
ncbi:MAG: DUF2974 domain-containing protein, partial [Bacilli bacterium]|nr:DUF2974 domain-containing protein [Bacilli bacterium]